jgi:uncharacterized protein YnzC (UPF0291/DUF896 family)
VAVSEDQIARINFLARKAKGEGLTLDERQEQIQLRQAYIQAVKDSLTPLLESIRVVEVTDEIDIVSVQMDTGTTEIEAVYMERIETEEIAGAGEATALASDEFAFADVAAADDLSALDLANDEVTDAEVAALDGLSETDVAAMDELTDAVDEMALADVASLDDLTGAEDAIFDVLDDSDTVLVEELVLVEEFDMAPEPEAPADAGDATDA